MIVLLNITTQFRACLVMFDPEWKHLQGLHIADPQFGVPGLIDILLGADISSHIIRHGQQCGPQGFPADLDICLGWVLTGNIYLE